MVLARFHKLEQQREPIGEFLPNIVPITPLSSEEVVYSVWPVNKRRVPRHPPRPRGQDDHGVAAAPLEENANDSASSGDECEEAGDPDEGDFSLEDALEEFLEETATVGAGGIGGVFEDNVAGGAASSSRDAEPATAAQTDAPPPPPPAPEAQPHRGAARAQRRSAEATCHMPGGSVSYYKSKSSFEAVCENRAHGRCVATRTSASRGLAADGFPRGGAAHRFLGGVALACAYDGDEGGPLAEVRQ